MEAKKTMAFSTSEMDEAFDYLFKIILIGDSNVGKTCVVHRFKSGQYHVKQQNTIGVDFTVRSLEIDGKKVKVSGTVLDQKSTLCLNFSDAPYG